MHSTDEQIGEPTPAAEGQGEPSPKGESGLRRREVKASKTADASSQASIAAELATEAAPQWLKPYAQKIGPVLDKLGDFLNKLGPIFAKLQVHYLQAHAQLKDKHPELIFRMVMGIVCMFFGGTFVTTIACAEAIRMTGWTQISTSLVSLWEDYKKIKAASDKDDLRDDDGDGIADVQQIDTKELVTRKIGLALRTCDPEKIQTAWNGLYTSGICVLATLKSRFARVVTLGATIGEVLTPVAIKFLHPALTAVVPEAYHKWIDPSIGYVCRAWAVSIAWIFQRLVSALHSSVRGAKLFTSAFAEWTALHGYHELSQGYLDEAVAAVCVVMGLSMQLNNWFSLPWPLYILLLPLVFVENILSLAVGMS